VNRHIMPNLPFSASRIDQNTAETAHALATVSFEALRRFDLLKRLA
jgi:hypothetical protein